MVAWPQLVISSLPQPSLLTPAPPLCPLYVCFLYCHSAFSGHPLEVHLWRVICPSVGCVTLPNSCTGFSLSSRKLFSLFCPFGNILLILLYPAQLSLSSRRHPCHPRPAQLSTELPSSAWLKLLTHRIMS